MNQLFNVEKEFTPSNWVFTRTFFSSLNPEIGRNVLYILTYLWYAVLTNKTIYLLPIIANYVLLCFSLRQKYVNKVAKPLNERKE